MPEKKFDHIAKDLTSGSPAPLYFFYGEEPYFVNTLTNLAEKSILQPGEEAFNKTVFYGKDSDAAAIIDQVRRFPMMAERQLVILKEAQALSDFAKLESVCKNPVPTTVFVIAYHSTKADKRKKVFKEIFEKGTVLQAKRLYENKVPEWVGGYLKKEKLKMSPRAITLLVQYLGTDLEKLANAIGKLAIASAGDEISDRMVEDTIGVNRQYNIFELQEAIGMRNSLKVLGIAEVIEKDLKNNPMPMMMASLFNYISKLYMIRPLGNNMGEVKKVVRIRSDFIVNKYISAARKYSREEMEKMIHLLREFDLKSKGIQMRDMTHEELFREFMLRLVHVV